jgi:RNA-directed DNA polymerase
MRQRRVGHHFLNIRSLDHLAHRLGVPLHVLEQLAEHVVWHYNPTTLRPKKLGGKPREIDAPLARLKHIQRKISSVLLTDLWLPDSVHAYRQRRSIKTAAEPHKGRPFLWVADIRQFYPSISHRRVYAMFFKLGCTPDVARLLTLLTTHFHRLPQGAPTSPALANLYLRLSGIARRIEGLAVRHRLQVTFFGDDILLSSEQPFHGLTAHLAHIVEDCGLRLHPSKTQPVVGPGERHQAIGVVMNSFGTDVDVPTSYRKQLRTLIRLVGLHGPDALRKLGVTRADPHAYLRGKITFAAYINPRNGAFFDRLDEALSRWTERTRMQQGQSA